MAAKTPRPRQPAKSVGGSFGPGKSLDDRYLFGTDTEVYGRSTDGYTPGGTLPEDKVPSFQQIRPGPTGSDANNPDPRHYVGDNKFGNHRSYR